MASGPVDARARVQGLLNRLAEVGRHGFQQHPVAKRARPQAGQQKIGGPVAHHAKPERCKAIRGYASVRSCQGLVQAAELPFAQPVPGKAAESLPRAITAGLDGIAPGLEIVRWSRQPWQVGEFPARHGISSPIGGPDDGADRSKEATPNGKDGPLTADFRQKGKDYNPPPAIATETKGINQVAPSVGRCRP